MTDWSCRHININATVQASLPRIRSNSWARPRANTGMRHLPPRLTISWTVPIEDDTITKLEDWTMKNYALSEFKLVCMKQYYSCPREKFCPYRNLKRSYGRQGLPDGERHCRWSTAPKLAALLSSAIGFSRKTWFSTCSTKFPQAFHTVAGWKHQDEARSLL